MSKFKFKDNRTFRQKVVDFYKSAIFWKGRKKGMIHTRDITWDDIRFIFFPKNECEKLEYLGYIHVSEDGRYYEPIMTIVRAMDRKARPWWCPRFFLRFLEVFGNDRSIVRVRNWTLYRLHRMLTRGYRFTDWKTKWEWYDLRISISACQALQDLADWTEADFYRRGLEEDKRDHPELFED